MISAPADLEVIHNHLANLAVPGLERESGCGFLTRYFTNKQEQLILDIGHCVPADFSAAVATQTASSYSDMDFSWNQFMKQPHFFESRQAHSAVTRCLARLLVLCRSKDVEWY